MGLENSTPSEHEPETIIEVAKQGDGAAIAHIQKEGWLHAYANTRIGLTREDILSRGFDSDEKITAWEERIALDYPRRHMLVARTNQKVVGFCVAQKTKTAGEISALYVLPEFHGRAVSKGLMQEALTWIGEDRDVATTVFRENPRAIRFYEKCGFTLSGIEGSLNVCGKDIPDLEMVRKGIKEVMDRNS